MERGSLLESLEKCQGQSNHKMYAFRWNFKTLKVSVAILNSIREETSSQLRLGVVGEGDGGGGGGESM